MGQHVPWAQSSKCLLISDSSLHRLQKYQTVTRQDPPLPERDGQYVRKRYEHPLRTLEPVDFFGAAVSGCGPGSRSLKQYDWPGRHLQAPRLKLCQLKSGSVTLHTLQLKGAARLLMPPRAPFVNQVLICKGLGSGRRRGPIWGLPRFK